MEIIKYSLLKLELKSVQDRAVKLMKKFLHEVEFSAPAYLSAQELWTSKVDNRYLLKMSFETDAGFIKDFCDTLDKMDLCEAAADTDTEDGSDDDSSDADA